MNARMSAMSCFRSRRETSRIPLALERRSPGGRKAPTIHHGANRSCSFSSPAPVPEVVPAFRGGTVPAVTLIVNGTRRELTAPEDTPLLYVLRNDLELRGPQFGCGLSQCGACSVLVDGQEA